ncbi:unnamed protein product, partial [Ectocarpus sp. 8 AP-2014]
KQASGEEQADFISTFGSIQPQNTMSGPVGNAVHKEWPSRGTSTYYCRWQKPTKLHL